MSVLRVYYMSIFLGILSYAAPIWASSGLTAKAKKGLLSAQRQVLLRVTRAYRTCSHAALHVVAGLPPIDLEIARRVDVYHGVDKRTASDRMLRRWQDEWALSAKGVRTREYFPSVSRRVKGKGLKFITNHYLTQVVTGHGNFNSKLHQFGLVQSPLCVECGVRDDVEHSLFDCPLGRGNMLNELDRIRWSTITKPEQIKDEHFGAFVRRVLVAKETRLRNRPG